MSLNGKESCAFQPIFDVEGRTQSAEFPLRVRTCYGYSSKAADYLGLIPSKMRGGSGIKINSKYRLLLVFIQCSALPVEHYGSNNEPDGVLDHHMACPVILQQQIWPSSRRAKL